MSPRRSVLLVHGLSSSSRTWWRVGPALEARGWDVSTVDLAGHGGRPIGTVRSVAELAEDVVAQHPEGPTLLVGHSLGAIVALELVAARPTYAGAVLLEDPPALSARRAGAVVAEDVEREVMHARADPHSAIEAILAGHPRWSRRDARSTLEGRLMTDPQVARRLSARSTWDLPALVAASPVPVVLVAALGRESALLEPDCGELLRLLPPGRVTEVRAGHHVHLDEPGRWVDVVDRFGDSSD